MQQEETNRYVFLQFIFQTNLQKTKYKIHGKRQARLFPQQLPDFLTPDVNEFLQLGKALLVRNVQCVGEFLMLSYSLF